MNDYDFLHQALEQAFLHPIVFSANGVSMVDYSNLTDCLRFNDNLHHLILPYPLSNESIKKYAALSEKAVKQRHNVQLYDEYKIYKHFMGENTIVPTNYPETQSMCELLNLPELSRQAAQRKKVSATIFPSNFMSECPNLFEQYRILAHRAEEYLQANLQAYNLTLINDFALTYKKIIKKFNISDFILWINKKRFRYYLNEAAQLLKSHQVISVEFYENHPFYGEKYDIAHYKIMQCKNNLKQLLFLLQKMSHEPQLLSLAQRLLADKKIYNDMFVKYRNLHKVENVLTASSVLHNLQNAFNKYSLLLYLEGVQFAFENKYLVEMPVKNQPPLPTISPQNEIKKISKIVEESKKIIPVSGKISQIYTQAIKDYKDAIQKLSASLDKSL
ncbi:MAG: hypothetical protein IJ677_00875 [Alphaproteobacteria bacterium]|nr:hypothetical protein [Alphaproteobacteria bacterium]